MRQASQLYGYREALLEHSRQSFEDIREERRRYADLLAEMEAESQDTQGLDDIQLQSQPGRRRTRGRRSSAERPGGSDA